MKSPLRPLILPLIALALAFCALPAAATTYMMMSDRDLADQAPAVVEAKVMGVEYAPTVGGLPATDYLVEVSRVLKGDLPGSTVMVRVPGGINPEGLGLKIWGAPRFAEGEEAILFLRPAQDGTYRIVHLMLGAFHKRTVGGRAVAVRDLSEATAFGPKGLRNGGADVIRDFERFSGWVSDRAFGVESEADYVVKTPAGLEKKGLSAATEKFAFLSPPSGTPIRWFRFERGQRVDWRVHTGSQPGLNLDTTIATFKDAIAVWNADTSSNVQYNYVGTTTANGGLAKSDGVNAIIFDDPFRDDPDEAVEGTFVCGRGGVIAIGGPWFFSSTRPYRDRQFHEAGEADIVTNDGTECLFRGNPSVAREVFAHELGHTLGLGHSDEREALMFPTAHNDNRGAELHVDDRAGIRELYSIGSGPVPGPTANLVAPARLTGKAASSTSVTLTWRDKSKGEEGFSIEAKKKGGKWAEVLTVPADSTSAVVENLIAGATHVFRVRAVGGGSASPYSNSVSVILPRRR
ncbi:MAG TPA: matrixin family metalloprotease [Thermoanaerobaculia bacterium]